MRLWNPRSRERTGRPSPLNPHDSARALTVRAKLNHQHQQ
jgi:hypothetical protein